MALLGRLRPAGGKAKQEFLDHCADMGQKRLEDYALYEDYYDGCQRTRLRDRTRRYLEVSGIEFAENFCEPAVDVVSERLEVIGFQSSLAADDEDPLGEPLEEFWQQNRMDATQGVVHTQTLIKGDGFVIVGWDAEKQLPRITFERSNQICPYYSDDEPEKMEHASKLWNSELGEKAIQRLNVYWPDRIEKWYREHLAEDGEGSGGWLHYTDTEGNWEFPWMSEREEPLGVPVFHFRHKPLGGTWGRSRLRPVIPFQDELNKLVLDLNELTDNYGMPQRWISGVTGDAEFKSVAGNIWQASAADANFGQFDLAPTAELLNAVEGLLSRLDRRSRLPMHLLTGGTPPSGEALKTAESGLVSVVQDLQVSFGNSWEDVMMMALKLAADEGVVSIPDDLVIECQWSNPETRSDEADLNVAMLKKNLGVSKATLLTELGYDPEREAGLRKGEAEEEAAAMARVLDSGEPGF